MATLVPCLDRFAHVMACSRPTLKLAARTMREGGLLPADPVGRNKGSQMTPPFLLNLGIGIGAGDPVAHISDIVRAYRTAAFQTPFAAILGKSSAPSPILGGWDLSTDLERLIDTLSRPSGEERALRSKFRDDFRVSLMVGEAGRATIERPSLGLVDEYSARGHDKAERDTFTLNGETRRVTPLRRIVYLDFMYFEVAAELWADSQRHGATYEPPMPPSGSASSETAASGPARDQNAAASSDQTAQTELGGSSTYLPYGEDDESSTGSGSRAGCGYRDDCNQHPQRPSTPLTRSFPHVRYQTDFLGSLARGDAA